MKTIFAWLFLIPIALAAQGSLDLLATLNGGSSGFGRAVYAGHDLNGGGSPDVVVGSYSEDKVYVYYGESFDDVADVVIAGENAGDYFGYAIGFCPDLNGDGVVELVVGANYYPSNGQQGRTYVYYGGSIFDPIPDLVIQSPSGTTEQFGNAVACGNCAGTAAPDIAIGAYGYTDGGNVVGRVYLFVDVGTASPDTLIFQGEATCNYDYFGSSVAVGPMDGDADAYDELLVGAPYADNSNGRAYLFRGGAAMDTTADLKWFGNPGATDFVGISVAALDDLDDDGHDDYGVGMCYRSSGGTFNGELYVNLGADPPDTTPAYRLHGVRQDYEYFGYSHASAGDVNGDTLCDLAVGATNYNGGEGRVFVFLSPFDSLYDAYACAPDPYVSFGVSVAACGDLDGDGFGEVVIGSDGAGRAYVFRGRSDFVPPVFDSVTQIADTSSVGPFTVSAVIYDPNGAILSDSLCYEFNYGGFSAVGHDSVNGDRYFYTLPETPPPAYTPVVVNWYLKASDGSNLMCSPPTAPATPYTFLVSDLAGPTVSGVTLWPDTTFTGPYPIHCSVADISGIASVRLYYATSAGQQNWLPMFPTGVPDEYYASVPAQSSGKLVNYRIEAVDSFATPNTGYWPADNPTMYSFILGTVPRVLLVDGETDDTTQVFYRTALDSLGVDYLFWPDAWGSPRYAIEDPSGFNTLIWFTGTRRSGMVTSEDLDTLASFFGRGGRMFLSSQNFGAAYGGTVFYQDWLHAQFETDSAATLRAIAVPGDSVGDIYKDTISIGGLGGANNANSKDVISPLAGADSVYRYQGVGGSAAVKYADTLTGHRLVYFAFPFEAINGAATLYAQRGPVMASILHWLGVPTGVAEDGLPSPELRLAIDRIVPNPASGSARVAFTVPAAQEVALRVYDLSGRLVKTLVQGITNAGAHEVVWKGDDANQRRVASGVYFVVLTNATQRLTEKVIFLR